jgi:hypothetical protein
MFEYTNRYGDVFTFTKQEDGDVLWEGDFKYCRFGWPNVYKRAYQQYCKDVGSKGEHPMHIEDFKEQVHEMMYNDNHEYIGPGPICAMYGHLVYSDTKTINMLDPQGGPYLSTHTNLGERFDSEELKGLCISSFTPVETGYLIGTYGEYDHLADSKIIGGIINTTEK